MAFNIRKRGITDFPELSGNAGILSIDAGITMMDYPTKTSCDMIEDLLEDPVKSNYDALTDVQKINNLHNPFPKIKSSEDYKTSLEKAIGTIEDNWLDVFFRENKDKRGRTQIECNEKFWSPDVFYLSMYEAARKLTLLALSPQFKKDQAYLTVFNEYANRLKKTLWAVRKKLPQEHKNLWDAEALLLKAYGVAEEIGPSLSDRSDKYEQELIASLKRTKKYVAAYKDFLSMPKVSREKILNQYNEKDHYAALAIAEYILNAAEIGNKQHKAEYKQLKNTVKTEFMDLRRIVAMLGKDAVMDFDARLKKYKVGFDKQHEITN